MRDARTNQISSLERQAAAISYIERFECEHETKNGAKFEKGFKGWKGRMLKAVQRDLQTNSRFSEKKKNGK